MEKRTTLCFGSGRMKSKSVSDDSFEPESSSVSDTPSKEGSPEEPIKLSREPDLLIDSWEPSIKNISVSSQYTWDNDTTIDCHLL